MNTYTLQVPPAQFEVNLDNHPRDGWKAKTRIALDNQHLLEIATYKPMAPAKGLRTQARVCTVREGIQTHVLSYGVMGDFSQTLIHSLPKRVTEAVVREQHDRVFTTLGFIDKVKADIASHYEAQHKAKHADGAHHV